MTESINLRTEVNSLIAAGQWTAARARLEDLWRHDGKPATANYISSCYADLADNVPMVKCRIAFLRSMTLEPLIPIFRGAALVSGINPSIHVGLFNSYLQELLDEKSDLYSFAPDIVILAVQTRDIAPEVWDAFADLTPQQVDAAVERISSEVSQWIRAFRQRSNASLILHNFAKPFPSQGVLDAQTGDGQTAAIERINAAVGDLCKNHRGTYVLDYDGLVARHGATRWHDETKWLTMRMPFAPDSFLPLVNEWLKFVHPLTGITCKALAVDLDNTLWGGVIGEDGLNGIKLGTEYPGAFYTALQRAILDLYRRGVLLAVCSKNNPDEALAVLDRHPDMLLRREHFSCLKINWQDKAQNIREIASELNIGTEAIAFLDDNPVEREWVRSELPEVRVVPLPDNARGYATALRDCAVFERLTLSQEDREKTKLYQEQQQRADLVHSVESLEDFYRSLNQDVIIAPLTPDTTPRIAQLTQKTNQYNVTTRRYTEQQIEDLSSRPEWNVYSVRVRDRFGDNGIVGAVITRDHDEFCEIDTFLLSCRVIGRTVETAMLGFITGACKAAGFRYLQGWFYPTKKNTPVRELYESHQFSKVEESDGASLWRLNLADAVIPCPEWIRLHDNTSTCIVEQDRA
jgi:FkbH-like protein